MKRIISLLSATGSPLRRNFVRVARANVVAQAAGLAASPVLSRIYSPADFGAFALFMSVAGLAVAVCTWRFDWSVPNTRHPATAAALMVLGFLALAISSLVTLCGVVVIYLMAPEWFGRLGVLSVLIPLYLVGAGTILMFEGWYVRTNDLRLVSNARIAQSVTNIAMAVGAGLMKPGPFGLVVATVIAGWVGIGRLGLGATDFWRERKRLTAMRLRAVFRRFRGEATRSSLVAVVNAASFSAIVIVLTANYALHEVGWYTFMYRLAATPIALVSASLGQSFWGTAADLARRRDIQALSALYQRTTRRLAWLTVPILIGCAAGPFVVGPLFGRDQWGAAGTVLLAMAPMLIGGALFSPTNHLFVLGRQSLQLVADMTRLILCVGAVFVCGRLGFDIVVAVALCSFASLFGYWLRYLLHQRVHRQMIGAQVGE